MTTPIQIRDRELSREIRDLASQTGKSITATVAEGIALSRQRVEQEKEANLAERRAAVEEIVARIRALPDVGPLLTDEDLYDENGLPR